ncbi:MAG: hypothetical protein JSS20_04060, partial [Proteobacteria bacterium]|nr:hypothetical protein [Pseudomonadota bacterium]
MATLAKIHRNDGSGTAKTNSIEQGREDEMAEAERTKHDVTAGDVPPRSNEDLDQLLQRISAHISEADRSGGPAAAHAADGLAKAPSHAAQPASTAGDEPPALRSALGKDKPDALKAVTRPASSAPASRPGPAAAPASRPAVTPPRREPADEPWDQSSAEALTRTWEAEAAAPVLRSALNAMSSASGRPQHIPAPKAAAIEAAESDLLEAARRVEAALERLAPREHIEAMGDRLDGLETRVGELGSKLEDDHIVALFGKLVPTAEDLTQFAEDAAGRAAERVLEAHATMTSASPSGLASLDDGEGLGELKQTLDMFMDERRRSEAGTQEALETLQLAMQHLLDRLENFDQPPAEAPHPLQGAPAPAATSEPAPLSDELAIDEPRLPPQAPAPHPRAAAGPIGHDLPMPPRQAATDDLTAAVGAVAAELRSSQPPRRGAPLAEPSAEAPPMTERQAMIAMARRAAENARAGANAAATPAAASAPAAKGLRDRMLSSMPTKPAGAVRPGVLIIAVAALLLAGYWFLTGPKSHLFRSAPAVTEQAAPVERATPVAPPAVDSTKEPDVDDGAAPKAAPAAPAAPKKTSADDAIEPPTNDMQRARVIGGPFETSGPGIAVMHEQRQPTAVDVMRANERARMASLSERAGYTAAQSSAAPAVSQIETSSVTPPQHLEPATESPRQLPLPPAT